MTSQPDPWIDDHFENAIRPQRVQLTDQIQAALDATKKGTRSLEDLLGGLFDIDYVDGDVGRDVERHLATAAHELRAALRVTKPLSQQ